MKVALVYDRVNKFGGAERVLESLHTIWPDAPLFTGVYHSAKASWAKGWDIRPSFLNRLPLVKDKHEYLAPFMPYAFEAFDFSGFDLVISVTSAEAKGIITKPNQLHLCYLLTPTRYLWSHAQHYQGEWLHRTFRLPLLSSLRRWDYFAAKRPDYLIAISRHVSARVRKYYRRQVDRVIYPPVRYRLFSTHPPTCQPPLPHYYLIVSRLVSYKSLDKVIQGFRRLPEQNLVVVGTGNLKRHLKRLAPPNVRFSGPLTDSALVCWYHHAKALIFPQEEDFGIVSLEAQAAGTPVIATNVGGAAETVVHHQTGLLFDRLDEGTLPQALDAFGNHTWYDKVIRRHAQRFNTGVFRQRFKKYSEELWLRHQKSLSKR